MNKTYLSLFAAVLFSAIGCTAQTEAEIVTSEIFKSDIESHIYFLASDELKGRETGSPEIDIAASYIANTLRRYKVQPIGDDNTYYQNIPLVKSTSLNSMQLNLASQSITNFLPLNNVNIDYSGSFILLENEENIESTDLNGKVVLLNSTSKDMRRVMRGGKSIRSKLEAAGAKAVIEMVTSDEKTWDQLKHRYYRSRISYPASEEESITHLMVQDNDLALVTAFKSNNLSGSLTANGASRTIVNSKNVVGVVEGTDPKLKNEYIIYSAHYDHVGVGIPNAENDSIYNGARDNAVGTVTVLSAAKSIAKRPTKRSALFILFTGEEKGLLGSKWYVEHPVLPLEQMVFCFNSDNGGYNDTSLATIVGLNRTTEGDLIRKASKEFGLTATDDPTGSLFNRSDNVMFARKGIPAPTFSLGFTAFDDEIGKYYHQAADNPDNLDYNYLEKFFRAYVLACRYIGNANETPFWTEGDSYYEAGKQLYNK